MDTTIDTSSEFIPTSISNLRSSKRSKSKTTKLKKTKPKPVDVLEKGTPAYVLYRKLKTINKTFTIDNLINKVGSSNNVLDKKTFISLLKLYKPLFIKNIKSEYRDESYVDELDTLSRYINKIIGDPRSVSEGSILSFIITTYQLYQFTKPTPNLSIQNKVDTIFE